MNTDFAEPVHIKLIVSMNHNGIQATVNKAIKPIISFRHILLYVNDKILIGKREKITISWLSHSPPDEECKFSTAVIRESISSWDA